MDWMHTLRLVLGSATKEYVLNGALQVPLTDDDPEDDGNVYATKLDNITIVQCLMLTCIDPELRKRFERFSAFVMIATLNALYKNKQERTLLDNQGLLGMGDDRGQVTK